MHAAAQTLAAGPAVLVLADAGLLLRPFTEPDLEPLARAFADPMALRWNPGPTEPDAVAAWVRSRNDWTLGDHASWAVADLAGADQVADSVADPVLDPGADDSRRTGGALLGGVSLHHLDLEQGDVEVGYWTAPWARRRGVAAAALRAAATFAHEHLGCHRVHLFHAVENTASCAVARRGGFALEGTLRASYRYSDGLHHDEHLHARLRDDPWP
ncbi:GNAT family protein [Nocardioides sp. GY 10127]|uniref:GNAT family N-acetyltransferase n=1 Tax=Nocardioides sp. GY 10127 TaxID=2569762 RepID=UPI0010A7EB7A|nr:GNAT family protein [Nocardioides sp. GY 10127]TIC81963.1 GNAT family N-acetyltransferase [Nocardioides sp. GY 10127]